MNRRWKDFNDTIKDPNSRVKTAYEFFISNGYSPAQAAGIVGNLAQESTPNLDSSIENGIGAIGIAQWLGPRRKALESFAKERGASFTDFDVQLNFILHELNTTEKRANKALLEASTPQAAAAVFVNKFERSGEKPGESGYDRRITFAGKFFNEFNVNVAPPVSSDIDGLAGASFLNDFVGEAIQSTAPGGDNEDTTVAIETNKTQQRIDNVKSVLQSKINQRNFLVDFISETEAPFVERTPSVGQGSSNASQATAFFQDGGLLDIDTDTEECGKPGQPPCPEIPDLREMREIRLDGTSTRNRRRIDDRKPLLTLEEREELIRTQIPERGKLETAADFVKGNVDEFLVNPVKAKISKLLPESIQFNRGLTTTSSDFDNTEGTLPYLRNNKSIEQIRQEKNISFSQVSEAKVSNHFIPLQLKKRIVNSIYPQGYTPNPQEFFDRFKSPEALGQGQIKRVAGRQGDHREDIFLMYAGLPQIHDTFTVSSFKAGRDSDTNITFKDPDIVLSYLKTAALRTDLFDKLKSGEITPESVAAENNSDKKGAEKINKASFRDPQNVMWNATFGIGFDETGKPYLSFYDNWDLVGKDDNVLTKGVFGGPIEIYDRIPLTEKLINQLARVSLIRQSNAESDKSNKEEDKLIESTFKERFKDVPGLKEEMNKVLESLKSRMQSAGQNIDK